MTETEEKKNKRIGLLVSGGVHAILLLLFIFLLAWKEPYPPLPEYGIEINFGTDAQGTGDVQPETVSDDTEQNQESEESESQEEVEEDVESESMENVEEVESEQTEQDILPEEDINSPDVIEEEKTGQEAENKEQQETLTEKKQVDQEEVKTDKTDNTQDDQEEEATSHGDNIDKKGDKGDPEGEVDARALYGNKGGGDGAALDMTGWIWDWIPRPDDTSDETGKIVFEIKIDDQGEILSVKTLQRGVSPEVAKLYEEEVRKLTFSKTSDNTRTAPVSIGKITFILKAK